MASDDRDDLPADGPNPWRELSRRSIYANDWMRVEEHDVVTPAGDRGIYGLVHPTHLALGVVPVDDDLHTWLVGQFRYALGRYSWEIPEGGGDPTLDPCAEAARELAEETGLTADRWEPLLELDTSNCFTSERAIVYLARDISVGAARPDSTEDLRVCRVPLGHAVDLVHAGRITDAISVAALLAVGARLLPSD